jgi:ribosome-binding factor A
MDNSEEQFKKKNEKTASIVTQAAAEFFERESDRTSMITVTRTEISDRGKKAVVYITVLPDTKEEDALAFSKRKRSELHSYLTKQTGLTLVPFVDVVIDVGEKNRQKLDALS